MEKVKITVEQEKALKDYASFAGGTDRFKVFMECHDGQFVGIVKEDPWYPLRNFTTHEMSLLLHGWYEVEQPFEAGDWVKGELSGCYAKLDRTSEGSFRVTYADGKSDLYANCDFDKYFEKITEQWKIILLNLGREKPEFHKDDVIVTESEVYEAEYLTDEEIIVLFEKDLVRAFHSAEHRIEVKGHDS